MLSPGRGHKNLACPPFPPALSASPALSPPMFLVASWVFAASSFVVCLAEMPFLPPRSRKTVTLDRNTPLSTPFLGLQSAFSGSPNISRSDLSKQSRALRPKDMALPEPCSNRHSSMEHNNNSPTAAKWGCCCHVLREGAPSRRRHFCSKLFLFPAT